MKNRLKKEGCESVTKCNQLKLTAADGKSYLTDVADPETLLRIIQSVPKAPRPSRSNSDWPRWATSVFSGRSGPFAGPRQGILAAARTKRKVDPAADDGETRNKLTDYWKDHEIKSSDLFLL